MDYVKNEYTFMGQQAVVEMQFKVNEHIINIMMCSNVHTHHCLHLSGQNMLVISTV